MVQHLDQQLEKLKTNALQQTATYRTSRDQLHQAIVDAYLWWRAAEKQKDYLNSRYQAAGIATRKRASNKPNFYPLVRLVWNIDIKQQAGTVSNWARSIDALHEEYTANPHLYAKDARADLINFIKDKGGLGGVRGEKMMTAEELEAEEAAGIPQTQNSKPQPPAATAPNLLAKKLKVINAAAGKTTIDSFPTAVTNAQQLIVMLGRKNSAGKIEILASDYSDELVHSVADACTELERSSVTTSLRLLAEALEPHALPAKLEKYRKKFFDDSEIKRKVKLKELDDKGNPKIVDQTVKQATRVRYCPSIKGFLISKAVTPASIVTYVTPHKPFDCADEVILRGEDRSWIERQLLNKQQLTLYKATPAQGLESAKGTAKATHMLTVENAEAAHTRRLYFYEASTVPAETNEQPHVKERASLQWDWELEAAVQWLMEFDALCATPYIHKIRGFFNRAKYASLQMQIGHDKMTVRYWFEEGGYAYNYVIPYGKNAKRSGKKLDTAMFTANAKDLALVFAVLPTLPISTR